MDASFRWHDVWPVLKDNRMTRIRKAACIGAGVIGSAWAARLAWNGIDVKVLDPHPDAEKRLAEVMANADRALSKLTMAPIGKKGSVAVVRDLKEAVHDADFIQESAPEREDLKIKLLAELDQHARPDVLICSSTSGLLPSNLQQNMKHPERFMVGHPFNPVYLMPLVEVVGGKKTNAAKIDEAMAFYRSIGMHPLKVRKEIDAFIADRLMEALWREALWLIEEDVATAEEIDDAVRFGPGIRWSFMGTFLIYRIAGGPDGMRHFMSQFGPALKWPWTKLMDVPEMTGALIDKIAQQSDDQAAGAGLRELERKRDDCIIAVMQALKAQDYGAGRMLAEYEKALYSRAHAEKAVPTKLTGEPLRLFEMTVPTDWTDYNNHMNESRYLQVFSNTSDAFMAAAGATPDYVRETKCSYYTAETHLTHKKEVKALEPVHVTAQLLDHDEKRAHIFYRLFHSRTGDELACCEQMMLHVDMAAGKTVAAPKAIHDKIAEIALAQKDLPRPPEAGRGIGIKRKV